MYSEEFLEFAFILNHTIIKGKYNKKKVCDIVYDTRHVHGYGQMLLLSWYVYNKT